MVYWPRTRPCRRLLPALLSFGEPGSSRAGCTEALKYVRFCIHRLESEDPAVHNLAVALLSLDSSQVRACTWGVFFCHKLSFKMPAIWRCTIECADLQSEQT